MVIMAELDHTEFLGPIRVEKPQKEVVVGVSGSVDGAKHVSRLHQSICHTEEYSLISG
jgi:hypothetical protein